MKLDKNNVDNTKKRYVAAREKLPIPSVYKESWIEMEKERHIEGSAQGLHTLLMEDWRAVTEL